MSKADELDIADLIEELDPCKNLTCLDLECRAARVIRGLHFALRAAESEVARLRERNEALERIARTAIWVADAESWRKSPDMDVLKSVIATNRRAALLNEAPK